MYSGALVTFHSGRVSGIRGNMNHILHKHHMEATIEDTSLDYHGWTTAYVSLKGNQPMPRPVSRELTQAFTADAGIIFVTW